MARGSRERFLPLRETRLDERAEPAPHEVAREGLIGVALVLDPLKPMQARILFNRSARYVEERAREELALEARKPLHAACAAHASAAQEVQQHGFGLVVEVVRKRNDFR